MGSLLKLLLISISISGIATAVADLQTNEISDYFVTASINSIFDVFLRHYREKVQESGNTQVKIPGFQEKFSTKIMSMVIEGDVTINDGWCGNISTVQRTGNADLIRNGSKVFLTAHLGLEELRIDYNNYDISFLGIKQSGKIVVNIGQNSVYVELKVRLMPKCAIIMTAMRIEQLDNINVDISNLGIFGDLTDDITSWVANDVTKWYRSYIETIVFPEMADIVQKADLCRYLPVSNL